MTSKRHGISDAVGDGGLRRVGLKATRGDELPLEHSAKLPGRNRTLSLMDRHVSFYAWLDDVQVGKSESA